MNVLGQMGLQRRAVDLQNERLCLLLLLCCGSVTDDSGHLPDMLSPRGFSFSPVMYHFSLSPFGHAVSLHHGPASLGVSSCTSCGLQHKLRVLPPYGEVDTVWPYVEKGHMTE